MMAMNLIPLESLKPPLLNGTTCKERCICGMSSRAEYVGCAQEKCDKSSMPMPNSLFCCCYWLLLWHLPHWKNLARCHWRWSLFRDIEMRFCNQWPSHISTVWVPTLSSKMTTLAPTELGLSASGEGGMACLQTSTPLNSCGISLGVLFVPEWPTQPGWLTCDKCWLKNRMLTHSRVWPTWEAGARLLWLYVVIPHTTRTPVS